MNNAPPDRLGLSVWLRLMKSYNLVLRSARRSVGDGLTLPQFDVMAQLSRRPDGMTFVELSRNLLVSAGNLTGIVDRLEREGLVQREAHESDGRSRRIRLTATGRRKIARLMPRHARDMETLFRPVARTDMRRLRVLLGRLAHTLETNSSADPAAGENAR